MKITILVISLTLLVTILEQWNVGQNRRSQKGRLPELPFVVRADDLGRDLKRSFIFTLW